MAQVSGRGGIMRKFLFAVSALAMLFAGPRASADVIYDVNINSLPTVPGTGELYPAVPSGAGGEAEIYGTVTPIYLLQGLNIPQGATVNLGTLVVNPILTSDQYGDITVYNPVYALNGSAPKPYQYYFACNIYQNPNCKIQEPPSVSVPLLFTYGSDVQISYINGTIEPVATSIDAVPEPSTWAMLLIGFAGIAIFARRRETGLAARVVG
jgi:PEP-CTERM motif